MCCPPSRHRSPCGSRPRSTCTWRSAGCATTASTTSSRSSTPSACSTRCRSRRPRARASRCTARASREVPADEHQPRLARGRAAGRARRAAIPTSRSCCARASRSPGGMAGGQRRRGGRAGRPVRAVEARPDPRRAVRHRRRARQRRHVRAARRHRARHRAAASRSSRCSSRHTAALGARPAPRRARHAVRSSGELDRLRRDSATGRARWRPVEPVLEAIAGGDPRQLALSPRQRPAGRRHQPRPRAAPHPAGGRRRGRARRDRLRVRADVRVPLRGRRGGDRRRRRAGRRRACAARSGWRTARCRAPGVVEAPTNPRPSPSAAGARLMARGRRTSSTSRRSPRTFPATRRGCCSTRVSLGVESGERIGVVGLNGGGKTTLLDILAGAEAPRRRAGQPGGRAAAGAPGAGRRAARRGAGARRRARPGTAPSTSGPPIPRSRDVLDGLGRARPGPHRRRAVRWREAPRRAGRGADRRSRPGRAGRADQPPRRRGHRLARRAPRRRGAARSSSSRTTGGSSTPCAPARGRSRAAGSRATSAATPTGCSPAPSAPGRPTPPRPAGSNLARKELAWLRRGPPARTSKPRYRIEAAEALIADVPPPRDTVELLGFATNRLGRTVLELEDATVADRRPRAARPRHLAARARATGSGSSASTARARRPCCARSTGERPLDGGRRVQRQHRAARAALPGARRPAG